MKKFNKNLIGIVLAITLMLGFTPPIPVHAVTTAMTPYLGVAMTYAILSDTFNNTSVTTTINGDIGFTTYAGPALVGVGGTHASYTPATEAGAAQASALLALNSAPNLACDFNWTGAVDLASAAGVGHASTTYVPGVYCIDGAMSIDTAPGITLSGAGTYIFRSTGAFTTSAGVTVILAGASACDVFWNPAGATTIGANNFFKGTVIPTLAAAHDITVNDSTEWIGRALTFAHTVTLPDTNVTITVPTCTAPATLNVIKHVVTDNGGIATADDWRLTVASTDSGRGTGDAVGNEDGTIYTLETGHQYYVTENIDGPVGYTATSAGTGCTIESAEAGETYTCTITNDDIAPTLTLEKVVVGGGDDATDWILTAEGPTGFEGAGPEVVSDASFDIGTYNLSEDGPSGYDASDWVCVGGTQVDGDTITLALDEDAVCTITNTHRRQSSSGSSVTPVVPVFEPTITILSTPFVVAPIIPKLPKTGFPPEEKNTMLPIVILSGLSLVSIFLYFAQKKQTT